MVQRTAALYGRDPREIETTAEVLVLRGLHPTFDVARGLGAGARRSAPG